MRTARLIFSAIAIAALCGSAGASTVTFSDNTFNLANYSSSGVFVFGGATLTYAQCATCGVGGTQGLQFLSTNPASLSPASEVSLINTSFSVDPGSQGAITSITFSVNKDFTVTVPSGTSGAGPVGSVTHPAIYQNGNYYVATLPSSSPVSPPGTTGYFTVSGTLGASDFTLFNLATGTFGTGHPNFASGSMQFGLMVQNNNGDTVALNYEKDYDNLQYTITTAAEPSWWFLIVGTALVQFAGIVRRQHAN